MKTQHLSACFLTIAQRIFHNVFYIAFLYFYIMIVGSDHSPCTDLPYRLTALNFSALLRSQ